MSHIKKLILVLVVSLCVQAAVSITAKAKVKDVQYDAAKAVVTSIVALVNDGILKKEIEALENKQEFKKPEKLDSQPDGACTSCFDDVFKRGKVGSPWVKLGKTYTYHSKYYMAVTKYDPVKGELILIKEKDLR